jgi:Ni/Co efflux regulator RcnB
MSGGARRRRGSKKSSKRMSGGDPVTAKQEADTVRRTMQETGLGAQLTKGNLIAYWTKILRGKGPADKRFAKHAEYLVKINKFKKGAEIPDTYIIEDIDYYTVENP